MNYSQFFLETSSGLFDFSILMIRFFIGICFIVHGLGKLGIVGSGNMLGFEGWLKSMNIPFAGIQARMAMLTEIIGGTLLVLGLGTRIGAMLCFFVMIVATLIGHKGGGYLITNNPPGREYTINLAAISALIFLLGPGSYSLDSFLF